MHFTALFVLGLATSAIALPQRPNRRPSGGPIGRPGGQNNQNNENQVAQAAAAAQPAPAAVGQPASAATQPAPAATQPAVAAASVPDDQPTVAQGTQPAAAANNAQTGTFDASLVPEFGIQAGQNPDGTGNCIGNNNVKIPCACPPDRQAFLKKVSDAVAGGNSEGVPVSFPTDNSSASAKTRIETSIIVLQNFNGVKGQGCPAAASTFLAQQAAA